MQTEFNEIESIEAFLDGPLMDEALNAFEAWRKQDPDSESKIEAQQVLRDGMYALAIESYKETLREWNITDKQSKDRSEEKKSRILIFGQKIQLWLTLAAAVIFVCVLSWSVIQYADRHYSDQALAQANYIQPVFPAESKIGQIDVHDCPAVIRSEIRSAKKSPSRDVKLAQNLLFFKGHCLYQSGDHLEAATTFQQVLSEKSTEFEQSPNAYWHLVLSLIASNKISDQEAIDLLEQLPRQSPLSLQKKAAALRQDLESGWRWLAD